MVQRDTWCNVVAAYDLFDQIVASARVRPLDIPTAPNGIPAMYLLQPVGGGRTYYFGRYLVVDVPDDTRLTLELGPTFCAYPSGCTSTLGLREEQSGSLLLIDTASGREVSREVAPGSDGRNLHALLGRITASIQKVEPPYLDASCDSPAIAADCTVLLEAMGTLAGDAILNWRADSPVRSWDGVVVDPWAGRVVGLDLAQGGLTGRIPAALGRLSRLEFLDLSSNELAGSIPPELAGLSNLRELNLSHNPLGGGIPRELGSLTSIRDLNLSSNQLSGAIPPELGGLPHLVRLNLNGNWPPDCIPVSLENVEIIIQGRSNLRRCSEEE